MVAVVKEYPRVISVGRELLQMWWAAAINFGIRKARELGCKSVITYNDDNVATSELL